MNYQFYSRTLRYLTVFYLFFFMFCFQTYAQSLSLNCKNEPLKVVLDQISTQTPYKFVYSNLISLNDIYSSINVKNESINNTLDLLFENLPISYTIKNNQIILNNKDIPTKSKITIRGVVVDAKTNEELVGAIIKVMGSNVYAITDVNGNYSLTCNTGDKLEITSLGMISKYVSVNRNSSVLNIELDQDNLALDEVVITGYQQVSKNQSTSSVAVIKADKLNLTGAISIENALQGQLAGLSVVSNSAAPGAAPKIRVRGTSTLMGNSEPLWVLDGVILESSVPVSAAELNSPDFMNTFNSAIGGISPNDIESITVLKDASATAIYGTRAANGVIVVTTKKGKSDRGALSYSHSSSISVKPSYLDFNLLNSSDRVELGLQNSEDGLQSFASCSIEKLINDYGFGNISLEEYEDKVRNLQMMNTDWFDILYRNAYTQTHDLSYSGATDNMDYYISLGYRGEEGLDRISNYNNLNGMAKVNATIFKGVKLGTTFYASKRDRDSYFQTIDPFRYAVSTARTIPLYDENGFLSFYSRSQYKFNIINEQNNTIVNNQQNEFKVNVNLSVDIVKGLKYNGLVSYSNANSKNITIAKENTEYVSNLRKYNFGEYNQDQFNASPMPYGGIFNEQNFKQNNMLIRNILEYNLDALKNKLNMNVMVGQEFRTNDYTGLLSNTYGYMNDRGSISYEPPLGAGTGHLYRNTNKRRLIKRSNESYFGVLSFLYDNRYAINANVRFDGSNLFGSNPNYRYLPLWSVSGKWILSNEKFLVNSKVISQLSLRASYGLRGNIVEDSSPQIIASALPPNPSTGNLEMIINQPPNPDLKWETTESLNIGLDFGLFNNRLNLILDYYKDFSKDLIAFNKISAVSGFLGKFVNYANVRNSGVDVSIQGEPIQKKNFSWTCALNFGFVDNKVIKSSLSPSVSSLVKGNYTPGDVIVGNPVNALYSYKFAGLDDMGLPTFYDKDGKVIKTNDPEMSNLVNDVNNLKYEGTRDPKLNGGFNNIIRYKNLNFSFLFSFGLMSKVRLPDVAYISSPAPFMNANKSIMDRWRKPGDEQFTNIPKLSGGTSYFYGTDGNTYYTTDMFNKSDYNVVSGDFLRLRNITLEYIFPKELIKKIKIGQTSMTNLSLRFQATNIFVIANKRLGGYDPETINFSVGEYGSLPLPRTFTLGLNLNF